jgi:hypothetical protein
MTAVVLRLLLLLTASMLGPPPATSSQEDAAPGEEWAFGVSIVAQPASSQIEILPTAFSFSPDELFELDDDDPAKSQCHASSLLPSLATAPRLSPFRARCSRSSSQRSLVLLDVEFRC